MKQVVNRRRSEANNVQKEDYDITLLVDGNSLLKTSLVDKRMNDKGEEYGAVFLFLRILGQLLQKRDFNHCVVCYDGYGSGVLRWQYYSDYKANRNKRYDLVGSLSNYDKYINEYTRKILNYSKQKAKNAKKVEDDEENFQRQRYLLQTILENLFVRQYIFDGVEGDDVISYYVHNKKDNEKVVIVSNDYDITQLINEDVCQYIPTKKKFISTKNSVEELGMTHENTVLKKMLCGDASDNIKGIKGVGEPTLLKLFPEMKNNKVDLEHIIKRSQELLDERKAQKKKPIKSLENIVNSITEGIQGKDIYEINKKIIDLSEPLMTDEAKETMNEEMYAPMSTDDRSIEEVYKIISDNGMSEILNEKTFGDIFGMYERLKMAEKRYAKKCEEN